MEITELVVTYVGTSMCVSSRHLLTLNHNTIFINATNILLLDGCSAYTHPRVKNIITSTWNAWVADVSTLAWYVARFAEVGIGSDENAVYADWLAIHR